ncbi:MAG: hypothetical protein EBU33_05785 [Sphingobacteriia bacterium]|nr:hypothetical protein [Sphingobacteriia bacterium]
MEDESDSDGPEGFVTDSDEEADINMTEQEAYESTKEAGTPSAISYSSVEYRKGYKGQLTATRPKSKRMTPDERHQYEKF